MPPDLSSWHLLCYFVGRVKEYFSDILCAASFFKLVLNGEKQKERESTDVSHIACFIAKYFYF